jgi:hypothetical protein
MPTNLTAMESAAGKGFSKICSPKEALSSIPFRGSRSRINGNHQCRKSCFACALNRALCRFPSAHQIELIPRQPVGRRPYVFQLVTGNHGKDISGARLSRRARSHYFSTRMHLPTVHNRREHEGQRKVGSKHLSVQVNLRERYGLPWPKQD